MNRRYGATASRFSQPDPYDGSYDLSDPQSFNRYAYVNNDPVNFVDPSGLILEDPEGKSRPSDGTNPYGFWSTLGSMHMAMDALFNVPFSAPVTTWTQQGGYWVGNIASVPSANSYSIFIVGGPSVYSVLGPTDFSGGGTGSGDPTRQGPSLSIGCIGSVLGHYLGRESLTLVKQQALNAGIGLGVLASRFFLLHGLAGRIAVGTMSEMGIEMFVRTHSVFNGAQYGLAALAAGIKLYPTLVRESFNNKMEALSALKACYD